MSSVDLLRKPVLCGCDNIATCGEAATSSGKVIPHRPHRPQVKISGENRSTNREWRPRLVTRWRPTTGSSPSQPSCRLCRSRPGNSHPETGAPLRVSVIAEAVVPAGCHNAHSYSAYTLYIVFAYFCQSQLIKPHLRASNLQSSRCARTYVRQSQSSRQQCVGIITGGYCVLGVLPKLGTVL